MNPYSDIPLVWQTPPSYWMGVYFHIWLFRACEAGSPWALNFHRMEVANAVIRGETACP
jgi:hypothetical protein